MRLSSHTKTLAVALFAFGWVTLIAGAYYAGHKPFSPAMALSIVAAAWRLLVVFGIVSLAGGLGRRLLPDFFPGPSGPAAALRLSVEAAVGLGFFALGVLVLGALGLLRPWVFLVFFVLSGLILFRRVWGWWSGWRSVLADWRSTSGYERAVQVGVFVLLILALIVALAPPLKFDALVYHLPLPKTYLTEGKVAYQPGNIFWGMPQTGEMIYTWAIGLAGVQAAAVAGWAFGALALLGIYGFTANRWDRAAGWTAVATLMSGYTFAAALSWAYIDWLLALYGLACLALLDEWRRRQSKSLLVWAGALAGMALGTKYTGGVALLAGVMLILITAVRQLRDMARPPYLARLSYLTRTLFLFCTSAVGVTLPWWIKNVAVTGNPFYPLIFPAGSMDALRLQLYQGYAPWGTWWEALLLPLRATTHGFEGGAGYNASIGPLLLALAPFAALLLYRLDRHADHRDTQDGAYVFSPAVFALVGLLIWAPASRISGYLIQTRMYFTIFPALAVLAGAGFGALDRLHLPQVRLRRVVGALVLLALWLNVLQVGGNVLESNALKVLLGLETEQAYLLHNLGSHALAMKTISTLPSDAQVLMLWETRSLYCQPSVGQTGPRCIQDEIIDRWLRDRAKFGDEDHILQSWRSHGYTHLLFYKLGADFIRDEGIGYSAADWDTLDRLLALLPAPQLLGEAYELYMLGP